MRKMIIDTDTGSDDAVALIMALKSEDVDVLAVTTVAGNVPLDKATKNALMTIEIAGGQKPPLYVGAEKPLFRELLTAEGVHGEDGMGDCDLIHPAGTAEEGRAVDQILKIIEQNPGEVEIVTIGPATNIALAVMQAPETMRKVKHLWSMGTAGFGRGNTTPVAEFNVYVDAEAWSVMMNAGIPMSVIGFDVSLGEAAWSEEEAERLLSSGKPEAVFAVECNRSLLEYSHRTHGIRSIVLPDAVAMAVVLWDDIVLEMPLCHCFTCTKEEAAYGQVIVNEGLKLAISDGYAGHEPNARVCRRIDNGLYKEKLELLLIK